MTTNDSSSEKSIGQPDGSTPQDGIRCVCGSEQFVVLRTTIEKIHATDRERREWKLRCSDCTQIGTVIGRSGGGFRRMSPTLKRTEIEH